MHTTFKPLLNRNAIVTGGARRIGRSIVQALVKAGCNVAIHYQNSADAALELATELRIPENTIITVQANLADPEQAAPLLQKCHDTLGAIDILINNASIFEDVPALQTTQQDLLNNFNIHTFTPFALSRALFAQLEGQHGSIINMLDYKVLRPGADRFAYTLSKAALANMTRSLALAFAPGLRVNGLALGAIIPPIDNKTVDHKTWVQDVPQQCWGRPEEIAELVVMLAREPGYINGEIIQVDGGAHLI